MKVVRSLRERGFDSRSESTTLKKVVRSRSERELDSRSESTTLVRTGGTTVKLPQTAVGRQRPGAAVLERLLPSRR